MESEIKDLREDIKKLVIDVALTRKFFPVWKKSSGRYINAVPFGNI